MKWETQMKHWNRSRTLSDALHYLSQLEIWDWRWRTQALTQDLLHVQCDWALGPEGHDQNPKHTLGAGPCGNGERQTDQFMSNSNCAYQSNAWQYLRFTRSWDSTKKLDVVIILYQHIARLCNKNELSSKSEHKCWGLHVGFFHFTRFWKLKKRSQVA